MDLNYQGFSTYLDMESRRQFIQAGLTLAAGSLIPGSVAASDSSIKNSPVATKKHNPIGVSTYSFWRFNGPKENFSMEYCIEHAARMGFDGIELLLVQMG